MGTLINGLNSSALFVSEPLVCKQLPPPIKQNLPDFVWREGVVVHGLLASWNEKRIIWKVCLWLGEIPIWMDRRNGEWYLKKCGSRNILVGSRNLKSIFDQSRSLVFTWFVFTLFESQNFLLKSLRLRFVTRILASRPVSDFTICHPW